MSASVFYALVHGSEWEDIEYFVAEGHALERLRTLSWNYSVFVLKYGCDDGCIFKKEGVYRLNATKEIVYDGV